MPMSKVALLISVRHMGRAVVPPGGPARRQRAGDIGPIRKEIIFEPLREVPVPAEPPPPRPPERPAEEPVPAAP
jgi:hypothetical protein